MPIVGGALATAGRPLFVGESDGWFKAYDAATGKVLWSFFAGAGVNAPSLQVWQRHHCLHGRLIASSGQAQCPLLSPFRTLTHPPPRGRSPNERSPASGLTGLPRFRCSLVWENQAQEEYTHLDLGESPLSLQHRLALGEQAWQLGDVARYAACFKRRLAESRGTSVVSTTRSAAACCVFTPRPRHVIVELICTKCGMTHPVFP